MSMFDGMNASASGMTAHRLWMDVIASNLANAESTRTENGQPFRRQMVVLEQAEEGGVSVSQVTPDPTPSREVYDPGHPDADASGIVRYPNVDPVREMIDMITASRAFEASSIAMSTQKTLLLRSLELGQR